jgi:hypothetical protein
LSFDESGGKPPHSNMGSACAKLWRAGVGWG